MNHNGRGTILKSTNDGLKRSDGTTAAERLFETEFPDLFSWLLKQMMSCHYLEKVGPRSRITP